MAAWHGKFPVPGFDSTQGTKKNATSGLNFSELAVYKNYAIKPLALIIYKVHVRE
jgi:hypothetical protein